MWSETWRGNKDHCFHESLKYKKSNNGKPTAPTPKFHSKNEKESVMT